MANPEFGKQPYKCKFLEITTHDMIFQRGSEEANIITAARLTLILGSIALGPLLVILGIQEYCTIKDLVH